MCRLFGMSGGRERVWATFWLLEAPDSLAKQSRRDPDGTGLGYFDDEDQPVVLKQPLAAYEDEQFTTEAREVRARTFVAHVRYASGTPGPAGRCASGRGSWPTGGRCSWPATPWTRTRAGGRTNQASSSTWTGI